MGNSTRGRWPLETPDLPTACKCERCGKPVYIVTGCDGDVVTLDPDPVDVRQDLFGKWHREGIDGPLSYRGGYRLDEPMWYAGRFGQSDDEAGTVTFEEPEWRWYATKRPIGEAADPAVELHGEHLVTCCAIDERERSGTLTAHKLTTENAIGDLAASARNRRISAVRGATASRTNGETRCESPRPATLAVALNHSPPPLPSEAGHQAASAQEQLGLQF